MMPMDDFPDLLYDYLKKILVNLQLSRANICNMRPEVVCGHTFGSAFNQSEEQKTTSLIVSLSIHVEF